MSPNEATAPRPRRGVRRLGYLSAIAAVSLLILIGVANMVGAATRAPEPSVTATVTTATTSSASSSAPPPPAVQMANGQATVETPCNLTLSVSGQTLSARQADGNTVVDSGTDFGAFLTSMLSSHEVVCLAAGEYSEVTPIQISSMTGVTIRLDSHAIVNATSGNRFLQSVVIVSGSPKTVIQGGQWIGPGKGKSSVIRIQSGSNGTIVKGADISKAGWDGILVYDVPGSSYGVDVTGNYLHSNGRYGVQEYANGSAGMMGTVISENLALDNRVGGIYTNGVDGVSVVQNVVANTVGDGPGKIGIGVTNGSNETVTANQVNHMGWFGIQAYYANYTDISDNVSNFNAGGQDQSGITNDHSSHDTIVGNSVESNGDYGVYVERSWDVTIKGNVANGNLGYGIGLNHGSIPTMGRSSIEGNSCSYNGLGGIILNSAVGNTISGNICTNNSGDGILLYNDQGQMGSDGNVVSGNWLGNEGNISQIVGVREANQSWNNTVTANETPEDGAASISLLTG